ncbi:MAG TPA: UxaA family hydrolase [Negativicutes bacterium]|nr:UxaA family hydrolase [Negativicutes bacterium]
MARLQAIVMKAKDNVCTVVELIAPGSEVEMEINGENVCVRADEAIPVGHKLAIHDIKQGEIIMKYGEVIGRATQNIRIGQHVHVHNLESCRGRGDR